MHVPEASVAAGFVQKADQNVVGVANTFRRNLVRSGKRLEAVPHAGTIFQNFSFSSDFQDELTQAGIGTRWSIWLLPIRKPASHNNK
jgi:hypothetical protein